MLLNDLVKQILNECSFKYVKQQEDGSYLVSQQEQKGYIMLDMTTANIINTVYNALSVDRQNRLIRLPLHKAIDICFKCVA